MTRPRKNLGASGIRTGDLPLSRRTPQPLGQRGGRLSAFLSGLQDGVTRALQPPHTSIVFPNTITLSGLLVKDSASRAGLILALAVDLLFGLSHTSDVRFGIPVATLSGVWRYRISARIGRPGAGIMEADDRQVTTVFTVQPSFHHRHSTNRVS